MKKEKVLVLGQTPPPYGGQAIMIEKMLQGKYDSIHFYHLRMAFSKDVDDIGKFRIAKVFHLIAIILKAIQLKYKYSIEKLYFPPSGPDRTPFYRDAIILFFLRLFFKKVCFHHHAGGLSELYPRLNAVERYFFRKAYFHADACIRLSENSPDDGKFLLAKRNFIVKNGIEDDCPNKLIDKNDKEEVKILFVALLKESKGLLVLIEAAKILKQMGAYFHIDIMGKFESMEFKEQTFELISSYALSKHFTFLGVLTGNDKFEVFAGSDIFCFPSFFESESFPVVLLEACCFQLPIVSTAWRGIPTIVEDGTNGFLVPVRNPQLVAEKVEILIKDRDLRMRMGEAGREIFLKNYTIQEFRDRIEEVLVNM